MFNLKFIKMSYVACHNL